MTTSALTTSTVFNFEFRCTNCYQVIHAPAEVSGQSLSCPWCRKSTVAPEATSERIEQAATSQVVLADSLVQGMLADDEPMSYADQKQLARRRAKQRPSNNDKTCRNPTRMSAARFRRLLAVLVDGVLGLVAGFLGIIPLLGLVLFDVLDRPSIVAQAKFLEQIHIASQTRSWAQLSVPDAAWAPLVVTNSVLILFLAFQWRMVATRGQSLGKRLLGIRIVSGTGQPPGFFRGVFVRRGLPWLLNMVVIFALSGVPAMLVFALSWPNLLLICLEPPRCLHDHIAGTFVVDA